MAPLNASRAPASPSFDDNDDLFNSADIDEIFREVDTSTKIDIHDTKPSKNDSKDSGATLGIDEEVKVTKKRQPIAKLDDTRLLSQAGIPKLRRTAKQKLKFKGKGHEYTDAARLLIFYQLWLDDLYPRAKFSDGLAMVEKLGHSKRMQVMRREWIDEGKPKRNLDDFPMAVDADRDEAQHEDVQTGKKVDRGDATRGEREEAGQTVELERNDPDAPPEGLEDLEELTEPMSLFGSSSGSGVKKKANQLFVSDDEGEEDDLDALLAAQTSNQGMDVTSQKQSSDKQKEAETQEENFDDEMEAMAGFDDPW